MSVPLGGVIQAGAQLLGNVLTNASTAKQNRKSRIWSQGMYDKQYQDSLAFWNMQNEYNTPERQMQRYQDAGLNPNLIYGQGNSGNASPIPTPTVQRPSFTPADFSGVGASGAGFLAGFLNMEIKQAQHDNLRADNTVKLEEAALKAAQRANTEQGTKRSKFDLDLDTELRSISAQARKENLRQMQIGNMFQLSENERRALSNVASLRESVERILNMRLEGGRLRAATSNLWKDNKLKQLDIELRQNGIMPSDPIYARILGRVVNSYENNASQSWYSKAWDNVKSWFK